MDQREAATLLKKICSDGPQRLTAAIRGTADALIASGLASKVKRGSYIGATIRGYEKHKGGPAISRGI